MATSGASDHELAGMDSPMLGDIKQRYWIHEAAFTDGPEAGTRYVDVRIAGGLHAVILADRGMDLSQVWFGGFPLAWISGTGPVHPTHSAGNDWLRLFHGGLMTGAGLENVGLPSSVDGLDHGLHGRLSLTPARNVHWMISREQPAAVEVRGTMREVSVHGGDLELERTYLVGLQEPVLWIRDRLTNLGYQPAPALLLYHFNIGHPVVAPGAFVVAPEHVAVPFDDGSVAGLERHLEVVAPSPSAASEVFELMLDDSTGDRCTVGVVNPHFEPTKAIAVTITYDRTQLPRLFEWRMMGEGRYLIGLEPSTCGLGGRRDVMSQEDPMMLQPGESVEFELEVRLAAGDEAAIYQPPTAHTATT